MAGFILTNNSKYLNISNNGQTVININKPFNVDIRNKGTSVFIFDVTGNQRISLNYSTIQMPISTDIRNLQNILMAYNNL